jgi:hypothetical protein
VEGIESNEIAHPVNAEQHALNRARVGAMLVCAYTKVSHTNKKSQRVCLGGLGKRLISHGKRDQTTIKQLHDSGEIRNAMAGIYKAAKELPIMHHPQPSWAVQWGYPKHCALRSRD